MTNPFAAPKNYPFASADKASVDPQQTRRERVKVTVYAVLGGLVLLCLGLLFQGCKHYEPSAENPMRTPQSLAS